MIIFEIRVRNASTHLLGFGLIVCEIDVSISEIWESKNSFALGLRSKCYMSSIIAPMKFDLEIRTGSLLVIIIRDSPKYAVALFRVSIL